MKRILTLGCLCAVALAPFAANAYDDLVEVRQSEIQKFVSAVGTVGASGSDSTTIGGIPYPAICRDGSFLGIPIYYPCIKYTSCTAGYSWSVQVSNIALQVVPGAIECTATGHCQASAGICGLNVSASYSPAITGRFNATWLAQPQEVWVAAQALSVEIYVNPAGLGRVHLGWVNVAPSLPNPLFKKKVPMSQSVTLPAPVSKSITGTAQNTALALVPGSIQVTTDINFTSP
jgi:hypothetical protein